MPNRITIDDKGLEIRVMVRASGDYTPDLMNDLLARALDLYREASEHKMRIFAAAADTE
jgi:hypothetical protein